MVQGINAQTTTPVSEKIVVDVSDLTPEQIATLKEKERLRTLEEKIEHYGKWVGMGEEIGIAVKEALMAVVDVSEKFGETKVGQFTLAMVAWKVVGQDILRVILGLIFQFVITVMLFKSLRQMYPRKYVTKSNGWMFWLPKEYEIKEPEHHDGFAFVKILHIFLLAGSFGLTYAIMFG